MDKKLLLLLFFSFFTMVGCDPSDSVSPTASPTCGTGVAHIEVLDGSMIRICGCTETANTTFTSGQSLVCTVSKRTVLYFDFVGITVNHQVSVIGVSATPLMSPSKLQSTQMSAVKLDSVGTFPFADTYYPTIGGNIIVQ